MTRDQIASSLEAFVRERFAVSGDDPDFSADVHLFDYGYVDSYGAIDLTLFAESTFDIQIHPADFLEQPMNTLNELADFVVGRRNGDL